MDRLVALKGEHVAVKEMRKHLAWYLKGLTGSARVKDLIMEQTKRDAMAQVLEDFVATLDGNASEGAGGTVAVVH
jgi:tRNA-dihydrouridine synthase